MIFKLVFNFIALVAIGVCGYYTTLYAKLSDDIEELKETLKNTCGRKQVEGKRVPMAQKKQQNDKKKE